MKKLLWYIIAGTRGGVNRARILGLLHERPYNTNQLAEQLHLDYKTVQHHLAVLKENQLVVTSGSGYGELYFLSNQLESSYDEFLEIWGKIRKDN